MKRKSVVTVLIIAVVLAVSLTACSGGLFGNSREVYHIDIANVEDSRVASIVANNVIDSCVRVIADYNNSVSASSGFVITEDGYVLTNRHGVLKYSSTKTDVPGYSSETPMSATYSVVFADNSEYSATLVAYSSSVDLAVLKISTVKIPFLSSTKFQAAVLETNHDLYYGERVYSVGNPENIGLVFSELSIASPALKLAKNDVYDSIILDGNINHGNSGGPLLNSYSRVSGIIYARVDGGDGGTYGLGCAIATEYIIKFLDSIKGTTINYKTTPAASQSGEQA